MRRTSDIFKRIIGVGQPPSEPVLEVDLSTVSEVTALTGSSPLWSVSPRSEDVASTPPPKKKLDYLIDELIQTEETYITDIEQLIKVYMVEFEKEETQKTLSKCMRGKSQQIFGNIREIVAFHRGNILPGLTASRGCLKKIFKVFSRHRSEYLSIYSKYIESNSAYAIMLKNPKIDLKIFEVFQDLAKEQQNIQSYLVKPIQRITKIQLLLAQMLKEANVEVKAELENELSKFLGVLNRLNSNVKNVQILGGINAEKFGSLCRMADVKWTDLGSSKTADRILLLFTKKLALAKQRPAPSYADTSDARFLSIKLSVVLNEINFTVDEHEHTIKVVDPGTGIQFKCVFENSENFDKWKKSIEKRSSRNKVETVQTVETVTEKFHESLELTSQRQRDAEDDCLHKSQNFDWTLAEESFDEMITAICVSDREDDEEDLE